MIHMMTQEQRSKRKVVSVKGAGRLQGNQFIQELFAAFEAGFVPAPIESAWTADAAVLKRNRREVTLYPKDYEVPAPSFKQETSSEEAIIASVDEELIAEIKAEEETEKAENEVDPQVPEPEVEKEEEEAPTEDSEDPEVKEEVEVQEPTVTDKINELKSKQDLLDLAKELNIEVPADKKNPAAIKKYLLTQTAE